MEQSPFWEADRPSARQETPHHLWNLKIHYCIHKHPPHVPTLNQINSVHASPPHFLKLHFKIIIPSLPRCSKWSFSTTSLCQNHVCISPVSHTCHMPCPIPRPCEMFHYNACFYAEEFWACHPTPKLEDHFLSPVGTCLLNVFTTTIHIWRQFLHLQPEDTYLQLFIQYIWL